MSLGGGGGYWVKEKVFVSCVVDECGSGTALKLQRSLRIFCIVTS